MTRRQVGVGALIAISIVVGSWKNRAPAVQEVSIGGYEVLAADFHVHPHPLSLSGLSFWDDVLEARRVGLDAINVAPDQHVWPAKAARWFSTLIGGGPIVLVGEEVKCLGCHIIAAGITRTIAGYETASDSIDAIHAQGGVAIAAHPTRDMWNGYNAESIAKLDGAEVVHPLSYTGGLGVEMREFFARTNAAAIGDTDSHGVGEFGMCRTYVFARERSAAGILDAIRARRTVVYDRERVFGDPALIALAAADGRLPAMEAATTPRPLRTWDGALGIAGLLAAVVLWFRADRP